MRKNGVSKANKVLLVIFIILFVIAAALFVITDPFDIFHLGLMEKIFPSAGVSANHIAPEPENPAGVSAPGTPQPTKTPTPRPTKTPTPQPTKTPTPRPTKTPTPRPTKTPTPRPTKTPTPRPTKTPTPRRTATPKRTPVPTQKPVNGGNRLIVTNYKGVNIRRQGNSGSDKVGHLDQGEVVTYSGSFSYGSKAYVQIKHSGGSGYVNTNDSANPFVVRFSEYYSSPKKISMNNGTNLYLLPDGSTRSRNKVAAANSGRQYTCIGKVNGVGTSSSYYVVKCDSDCRYTDPDSGKKYTIKYAFVRERDVKNIK